MFLSCHMLLSLIIYVVHSSLDLIYIQPVTLVLRRCNTAMIWVSSAAVGQQPQFPAHPQRTCICQRHAWLLEALLCCLSLPFSSPFLVFSFLPCPSTSRNAYIVGLASPHSDTSSSPPQPTSTSLLTRFHNRLQVLASLRMRRLKVVQLLLQARDI